MEQHMNHPGNNPCEPTGSFCKTHRAAINGDNMCRVRRAWRQETIACLICGVEEPKRDALALNTEVVRYKGQLQPPIVSAEFASIWLKVAKSNPGTEAICVKCGCVVNAAVCDQKGNRGRVRVRPDAELPVRTFAIIVPFVSKSADSEIARQATPVPQSAVVAPDNPFVASVSAMQPWRPKNAVEVANAILDTDTHYGIERAAKRPRADGGKGQDTQCVVAANHGPCESWGDWREMRTVAMPTSDGSPPKAYYPFCAKCQAECEKAGIAFGPVLFQIVTGRDPAEARRAEAPRQDSVTPIGSAYPARMRDHDGRVVGRTGKTAAKRDRQRARIAEREEEARKAAAARAAAKPDKPSAEERKAAKDAAKGRR